MDLLDLSAYFDPIDRIEGALSTFRNADWKNAYEQRGVAGLIAEFVSCITSYSAPTICVARGSHWRSIDVERLLKRHGVKIWDRGIAGDDLYFCVKRRQVKWAEYLLLRAGVPVTSILVDPRNADYAKRYAPGSEPPTRKQRSNSIDDWIDRILSFLR